MPRRSRIDAPGTLHHIIVRGIERKTIFKDDADRNIFLRTLEKYLSLQQVKPQPVVKKLQRKIN